MKRSEIKEGESYAYGRYPQSYGWFKVTVIDATPIATTPRQFMRRSATEEEKYQGQPLDGVMVVREDSNDKKPFRARNRFLRQPWNDFVAEQDAMKERERKAALARREHERMVKARRVELRAAWPGNVELPLWLEENVDHYSEGSGKVDVRTLLELIKAVK